MATKYSYQENPTSDLTGTMILFPSYLLHRISEVTRGPRYSMVGWAHGKSFY